MGTSSRKDEKYYGKYQLGQSEKQWIGIGGSSIPAKEFAW